jgi:hypothetical protein
MNKVDWIMLHSIRRSLPRKSSLPEYLDKSISKSCCASVGWVFMRIQLTVIDNEPAAMPCCRELSGSLQTDTLKITHRKACCLFHRFG